MPVDAEALKMKLWAETGLRENPENVGLDRALGWTVPYEQRDTGKFPELEVYNQLYRELTGAFLEALVSVPRWVDDWDYPLVAFVVGEDGTLYRNLVPTGPNTSNVTDPALDTDHAVWRPY